MGTLASRRQHTGCCNTCPALTRRTDWMIAMATSRVDQTPTSEDPESPPTRRGRIGWIVAATGTGVWQLSGGVLLAVAAIGLEARLFLSAEARCKIVQRIRGAWARALRRARLERSWI